MAWNVDLLYTYAATIEHCDDNAASLCDALKRINTILIDMSRDIWQYISMEYLSRPLIMVRSGVKDGEIGSSAMPHKVNPIYFENAEGNIMCGNVI